MACDDIWWSAEEKSDKENKNEEEPWYNHKSESDGANVIVSLL